MTDFDSIDNFVLSPCSIRGQLHRLQLLDYLFEIGPLVGVDVPALFHQFNILLRGGLGDSWPQVVGEDLL